MIYQETPYDSNRLFLYRDELPENPTSFGMLQVTLGAFSIWGNFDANTDEYLSWEFSKAITEEMIKVVLFRLNVKFRKS